MTWRLQTFKKSFIFRSTAIAVLFTFMVSPISGYAQDLMWMPAPGVRVSVSPEFTPPTIKGLTIHQENPLLFDFIIDQGDKPVPADEKKEEYRRLVKYFLASLTLPEKNMWVNLSPYEKNRVIADDFGKTEMGRDLLSQDYILKQLTASLIYPEEELGKKFWDKVYKAAYEKYGSTDIPVNTFNKVWIVPDEAVVYESGNTALILRSHLKVMLEEDYLSLQNNSLSQTLGTDQMAQEDVSKVSAISSKVVREIVLPAIEKEVNEGKNFALLRQIYSGMVLATWYKKALKESLLGKIYVDQGKVKGVDQKDAEANQKIYEQYVEAFKKGAYNYIKEDYDEYSKETIPRKYFSGGFSPEMNVVVVGPDNVPSTFRESLESFQGGLNQNNVRMDNTLVRVGETEQEANTITYTTNPTDVAMLATLKGTGEQVDFETYDKVWIELTGLSPSTFDQVVNNLKNETEIDTIAQRELETKSFWQKGELTEVAKKIIIAGVRGVGNKAEAERLGGEYFLDNPFDQVGGAAATVSQRELSLPAFAPFLFNDQFQKMIENPNVWVPLVGVAAVAVGILEYQRLSRIMAPYLVLLRKASTAMVLPLVINWVPGSTEIISASESVMERSDVKGFWKNGLMGVDIKDEITVGAQQSLGSLAYALFGEMGHVNELATAKDNNLQPDSFLKLGQPLKVPDNIRVVQFQVADGSLTFEQIARRVYGPEGSAVRVANLNDQFGTEVISVVPEDGVVTVAMTDQELNDYLGIKGSDAAMLGVSPSLKALATAALLSFSSFSAMAADNIDLLKNYFSRVNSLIGSNNIAIKEFNDAHYQKAAELFRANKEQAAKELEGFRKTVGNVTEKDNVTDRKTGKPITGKELLKSMEQIVKDAESGIASSNQGAASSKGSSDFEDITGKITQIQESADKLFENGKDDYKAYAQAAKQFRAMAAAAENARKNEPQNIRLELTINGKPASWQGYMQFEVDFANRNALTSQYNYFLGRTKAIKKLDPKDQDNLRKMLEKEIEDFLKTDEAKKASEKPTEKDRPDNTDIIKAILHLKIDLLASAVPFDVQDLKIYNVPATSQAMAKNVGGIDFNAANLNLQIKRDGQGVPLPISSQDISNIHIDGFIPVILEIQPVTNLPLLLGSHETQKNPQLTMN